MDENKLKQCVSVKEIEDFAKKHRYEVFFCLLLVFACIFGVIGHFKAGWSIILAGVGGILGFIFPAKIEDFLKKAFGFALKQDLSIQIVIGIASLIIAIFLPFVIFFVVGCFGGHGMYRTAMDSFPKA